MLCVMRLGAISDKSRAARARACAPTATRSCAAESLTALLERSWPMPKGVHVTFSTLRNMARGAKSAAALRTLVASLEANAPSHKLPPTLTALQFTVPRTFGTPRLWELMRRELPRIAYANPDVRIGVSPLDGGELGAAAAAPNSRLEVHFSNMPTRTIVIGEKSRASLLTAASEVTKELMAMAQFASRT